MWDLIVSVPDHCLSFYLGRYQNCHLREKFGMITESNGGFAEFLPQDISVSVYSCISDFLLLHSFHALPLIN